MFNIFAFDKQHRGPSETSSGLGRVWIVGEILEVWGN